jgi:membrane protease YdiL (CAAX protease family)
MRDQTRRIGRELGRGFLAFLIAVAIMVGLAMATHGRISNQAVGVIGAAAIAIYYVAALRWIERRPVQELAQGGGAVEFTTGLSIGIALFSLVMAVLWAIGVYHPSGWGTFSGLGSGALFALSAAVLEEILFRGYLFRLLSSAGGTWIAVLITSTLFGVAHAANPGATLFSSFAIAVEAGVILAGAYALTGRLWMPIGLHLGWNFAESTIWGMSVSGGAITPSLTRGNLSGAPMLTGGAFGPEASIVAVALSFAVGATLLWQTARLGRVQPPMWRFRSPASDCAKAPY